jgi:RNA polymerase sigma-70 factor, ECF subfamily
VSAREKKEQSTSGPYLAALEPTRLVGAAQAGDRSAFAELYRRYAGMVHSIALSRLQADEVADVVQEVFFRALSRLKTLRKASAFGTWIATIARNVVHDVELERSVPAERGEEPLRPDTQYDEMEVRAALRVIRSLPRTYRETITMRLVQGMTGPEIADRTGLSEGPVRVNLHRGMKLLRQRLQTAVRRKRERNGKNS